MTIIDALKAVGVALALMVLNVAAAFVVVWAYSMFVEPGHEATFYEAAAQHIAPWSSIFAGGLLFFAAMLWLAWRKGRNGYVFAASVVGIYSAIDIAVIAAAGALGSVAAFAAFAVLSKLGAALLGAWLGRTKAVA